MRREFLWVRIIYCMSGNISPVYFELNVESIWSIGMLRDRELELPVAVSLTSSGENVRISIMARVSSSELKVRLRLIGLEQTKEIKKKQKLSFRVF